MHLTCFPFQMDSHVKIYKHSLQVNISPTKFSNSPQVDTKTRNRVRELKPQYSHKNPDVAANYQPETLSGNSLIIDYVNINDDILITHFTLHKVERERNRRHQFSIILTTEEQSQTTGSGKKETLEMRGGGQPAVPCLTLSTRTSEREMHPNTAPRNLRSVTPKLWGGPSKNLIFSTNYFHIVYPFLL